MAPLPIWEALGIVALVGASIGIGTYALWRFAESRLPGYSHVDKKTRDTERYLERVKQGMRDK
jgi:hypothetical protein